MGRIRTVKPELFVHSELFDAEHETKLPLRLAYIALFTCCDRAGRFKWRPRELKLACLPHDEVDFSRVLDALATRGFVVRYASDYGCIPTWERHQVINNRESGSDIPAPTETDLVTRAPRVEDACPTPVKGKGREGKGKEEEGKGTTDADASKAVYGDPRINECIAHFTQENGVKPDDSQKWVRIHCANLLKWMEENYPEPDALTNVKAMITAVKSDPFHGKNACSFKYLYNYRSPIAKAARERKSQTKNLTKDEYGQAIAEAAAERLRARQSNVA